jgi:hypothetical protein
MALRGILFWPVYRVADWVDEKPVSAIGGVVALGALVALLVSVSFGSGAETGAFALDATTAGVFVETARERPAYLAAVAVGVVVVLFYDG